MKIISRKDAQQSKNTRFFTGKKCKNGHIDERLVSNSMCISCTKEKKKQPHRKELANIARRNNRSNNPDKYREEDRKKRLLNLEKIREQDRKRYYNGKAEKASIWVKEDRKNRPWVYTERARRRKKYVKRATPKWLNQDQKREIIAIYKRCSEMSSTGEKHHVDHIIPLNGENVCGLHVPWNLQVIKASDNLRKGNRVILSNHGEEHNLPSG